MRSKKASGGAQPISGERPAILWISPTSGPKLPQRGRCCCSGGPCAAGLRRSRVAGRRPSASPGAYVAGLMYAQARPGRTARADAPEGFEGAEGPGSAPRDSVLEPHGASSGRGYAVRRSGGVERSAMRVEDCVFRPERTSPANDWGPPAVVCGRTQFSRDKYVPERGRCGARAWDLRREGGDEGTGLAGPGDGELVPGAGRGHVQQRALPQEGIGAVGLGVLLVAQ